MTNQEKENLITKERTLRTGEEIAYLSFLRDKFLEVFQLRENEEVVGCLIGIYWVRKYKGDSFSIIQYKKPLSRAEENELQELKLKERIYQNSKNQNQI